MTRAVGDLIKKSVSLKHSQGIHAMPALIERAWTCASPGQQVAIRNAILRAFYRRSR